MKQVKNNRFKIVIEGEYDLAPAKLSIVAFSMASNLKKLIHSQADINELITVKVIVTDLATGKEGIGSA